jgi:diguanylate cyclase (GGDEF)-like protein
LFSEELDKAIVQHGKQTSQCIVLFLDLDKFKIVNDTMGHKAGDTLLIQTAARLSSCLRQNDILARMGGDEFTVLLKDIKSIDDAAQIAQRMLEQVSIPYEIKGTKFVIGVSIGGSIYPDNATDAVGLLKTADAAMYKAKDLGRNNCQFYSEEISQENRSRVDLENDFRLAIQRDELKVFYQPIVDARTMRIVGAEALLRWNHPRNGMISPGLFIPIAEETGLIIEVGKMVLETACKQCKLWQNAGFVDFEISINVSPVQLNDIGIIEMVDNALSMADLVPQFLKLEVVESVLAKNSDDEVDILSILRSLGLVICLDDFGIGYSSLERLSSLPVGHVKIDGHFIRNIVHKQKSRAMVESIVTLAHNLGMKVTAEWIEDETEMAAIRSLNCDLVQGYLISPALSADAFERFANDWKSIVRDENAA